MASIYTFLNGVAVFTGSPVTAGLLMYVVILMLVLVFMKSARSRFFFIALPITLICSAVGLLQSNVMYLILILNLIGIVVQYRRLN